MVFKMALKDLIQSRHNIKETIKSDLTIIRELNRNIKKARKAEKIIKDVPVKKVLKS